MSRLGLLILAFTFFCLAPANLSAFQLRKVVMFSGNVYYGDNSHPAKNIPVQLNEPHVNELGSTLTSDLGEFRFGDLNPGTYVIKIDVQGYQPVSMLIDLTFASERDVPIYLKPISDGRETPKGADISSHELSMPEKARDLMDSGKKKVYQDKNAAAGLADFQQAVSIAPGYYEAYYQMAMAYLNLAKPEDAEKSFKKSIEVSGDKYGEADIGLGALMVDKGDLTVAERTIRRGVELSPQFWLGHYELGKALFNEKQLPEAQKSAEQARTLAPAMPIVYRLLSNIHLQEKNYPAVVEDIDAYIKLDPDSPAGIRAKQLREEIVQKIPSEKTSSPPVPKP